MSTGTEVATLAQKKESIEKALVQRAEVLKELLPPDAVDQAPRLIRVAMLYFTRSPMLQEATPVSFIQCAFDSVAAGIPLDGKLGHAVVFNNKVKTAQGERWEKQVKFMPDFKGIVSVARRTKQISDAVTFIVHERDYFVHGRQGPNVQCDHTPADGDRGEMKGACCILTFPEGGWTYEFMSKSEIDKVRNSSKSKDSGPWVDWYDQMARKTVLKRALKTYCDDPQLLEAFRADDDFNEFKPIQREARVQQSSITTLKQPTGAKAIAHEVAEQQSAREQPEPETKAPSKPRKQRQQEQEQEQPQAEPEDFGDVEEPSAEVAQDEPMSKAEIYSQWADKIDAATKRSELVDLNAQLTNGEKRLSDADKLPLVTMLNAKLKPTVKPAPKGELFDSSPNMGK